MSLVADHISRHSIDTLLRGQSRSGALVASPSFATYDYAWLRDGAFCAHALDLVGETAAAAAWHAWVVSSVESHRALIESAVRGVRDGRELPPEAFPPARYTLEGSLEARDGDEPWPNFQIDGYGIWLWALEQHLGGVALSPAFARTVELVARYLEATWQLRCFSCWEELDGGEHGSTLGAVAAGLAAAARLLDEPRWDTAAATVRGSLTARFVHDGRFGRGPEDSRVDGSLLWLVTPFSVLPDDDTTMQRTITAVERDLAGPGGGLYRYLGDSYYGGGQWLLLTSLLAWHYARTDNLDRAVAAQNWVRAQALPSGDLTEQVTSHAQDPTMIAPWVERWGSVATPLLWSHAMYLIAEHELHR